MSLPISSRKWNEIEILVLSGRVTVGKTGDGLQMSHTEMDK